ncbi:hypothetical protein [uncultured Cetobacterium sp.]|uniref:hypothetical protein n=1 Tax=uncultured Cetobacterium sp. TaxID=527638 RepID=UPI002609C787|nr:hypothetical protein [uncultured Cetobacterium sp.]
MSNDILRVIKKHSQLFFLILCSGLAISFGVYLHTPIKYYAQGAFSYVGIGGSIKTTKLDNNGIVTYENFKPGDGDIVFSKFITKDNVSIKFNSGEGTYTVIANSLNSEQSIIDVNEFLDSLLLFNQEFLFNKLSTETSNKKRVQIQTLINNPKKSFPLIIKAETFEVINNRYLILFYGFIISFIFGITTIFLKEKVENL